MSQKVNRLARQMGQVLAMSGIKMLKSAFHLKPKQHFAHELNVLLKDKVPSRSFSDSIYYAIDWETWKSIIEVDWTDKKKYLIDKWDCDNFAFAFAARMSEIYDLNTAGVVYGTLFDDVGKKIGGHAFNVIVSHDESGMHVHWYEPMKDLWTNKTPIVMNKWTYRPNWVIFF